MQNTVIFLALKIKNFKLKNFDIFLIFAQNIDCGYMLVPPRRGGSNEYPQSMFWSKNKKNRYIPAYSIFYIKVGYKGVYMSWTCFPDGVSDTGGRGSCVESLPLALKVAWTAG